MYLFLGHSVSIFTCTLHIAQVLPCEMLLPPMQFNYGSKRLCLQNFYALPSATACFGDSGGPLVVCEGDRTVVIGVASFIANPITSELSLDSKGPRCINDTTVSAYVDIQQYLPWIRRNIGEGNNRVVTKEIHLSTSRN